MRSPASLRRRRLRRGVNPTLIIIGLCAVAALFAGWRIRGHYLELYEDTEVPRRQLTLLAQRRDLLNQRLSGDDEAAALSDPVMAGLRADLEEVNTRLSAVEAVRTLTIETYRARVSPTLIRLLRLPRVQR